LYEEGKTVGKIFALPTDQSHLFAVAPGHDPKAIVLDLMNPQERVLLRQDIRVIREHVPKSNV
jgi:hypothetical protein